MPVRRNADPQVIQHVWDGFRFISVQWPAIDMPKLSKYVQKACGVNAQQAESFIRQVVKDKLLLSKKNTKNINKSADAVVECYKLPFDEECAPIDDGHDWYCIECHLSGDVVNCHTCFRVFHLDCVTNGSNSRANINKHSPLTGNRKENSISALLTKKPQLDPLASTNTTVDLVDEVGNPATPVGHESIVIEDNDSLIYCTVCRMLRNEMNVQIDTDELNYLLSYTLSRIRIWLPSNITDVMAPRVHHPWMNEAEIGWRSRHLIYQTMDIPLMEMKLRTREYTRLGDFHADVLTIQHNVAIFHGVDSQEYQGSELMVTDSKYDLVELQQCVDCYKNSNEKTNELWFCIPCKPAHQLVWAKQKGYPYWPAKLIRVMPNGQHDVRFFGAKHLRALIDTNSIKPIETSAQKMQIKKTQGFQKAMQELAEHQRLLKNPGELPKFLAQLPEFKAKTPNRNKTPVRRLTNKDSDVTLDDVYEFSDAIKQSLTESEANTSTGETNAKKRGRPKAATAKVSISPPKVVKKKNIKKPKLDIKSSPTRTDTADSSQDAVISSTDTIRLEVVSSRESSCTRSRSASGSGIGDTQQLERAYSDPVEGLRRQLEIMTDTEAMIRISLETMQLEMDRMHNSHSAHVREIEDSHRMHVSEVKKKQWCYNCELEAIYHCCWNTAYCSTVCQQQHWISEHKKVCRRKR